MANHEDFECDNSSECAGLAALWTVPACGPRLMPSPDPVSGEIPKRRRAGALQGVVANFWDAFAAGAILRLHHHFGIGSPGLAETSLDLSCHQDNNATVIILEAICSAIPEVKSIQLGRAK